MLETLVTAAVTLIVGVGGTWLTIGGRERQARRTITEELDLLERLNPGSRHAAQLSTIVHGRLEWYVRRLERKIRRATHLTAAVVDVLAITAIVGVTAPDIESVRTGVILGVVLGAITAINHVVVDAIGRRYVLRDLTRPPLPPRPGPAAPGTARSSGSSSPAQADPPPTQP